MRTLARTDITGTTFAPNWQAQDDANVIAAHEAVHRAQFDNLGARPVGDSARLEREANLGASVSLAGGTFTPVFAASPGMSLAFGDDPPWSTPDQEVCELDPPANADVDAGTCEIDEDAVLENTPEPLASAITQELTTDPARQVCQVPFAEASFDPEMIDVPGMRNDTINSESIRVDDWISKHSFISPVHDDLSANRRLQQRLKAERAVRVQTGHLWMTTAVDPTPEELLMLNNIGGEPVIIKVDQSIATGTPTQSFPGPIMTRQQFNDHMSGMSVPIISEQEYVRTLLQTAEHIAPWLLRSDSSQISTGNGPAVIPFADPLLDADMLSNAQVAAHAVGGSGLYRSPFSIGAQDAYADRFIAANGSGREIMQWRGGIGEAGYSSTLHGGGRLGTTPLNNLDWMNYSYTNPRQQRASQRNYPVFDFQRTGGTSARILGVSRISVKASLQADFMNVHQSGRFFRGRMSYYAAGMRAMLDAGSRPTALRNYIRNQPGQSQSLYGTGAYDQARSEILSTARIAVNADDVGPMRRLLRQVEANWGFSQIRPIYSAILRENPIEIRRSTGLITIDSAAAFSEASLTPGERTTVYDFVGKKTAELVISSGVTAQEVQNLRDSRIPNGSTLDAAGVGPTGFIHPDMSDDAVNRTVTPDFIESARRGGGVRGTSVAATRNGLRGGAGGGVIAVITTAGTMFFDEADHPNWESELGQAGGMGTLGGFLEGGVETSLIAHGTRRAMERGGSGYLVQQGARFAPNGMRMSTGLRVGGAGAAGGIVGPIMEGVDMSSDGRDNSVEEVVVRSGRAAVIGGVSGAAGAASGIALTAALAGTAFGGPIGFVAGLAIGFGLGLAAEYLTPFGRDHYEQRHREEQERLRRKAEARRRRDEQERRDEAERRRQARLDQPLSSSTASTVGVEGIFETPTNNPMFNSSQPGVDPTVGELEHEYVLSILRASEMAPARQGVSAP